MARKDTHRHSTMKSLHAHGHSQRPNLLLLIRWQGFNLGRRHLPDLIQQLRLHLIQVRHRRAAPAHPSAHATRSWVSTSSHLPTHSHPHAARAGCHEPPLLLLVLLLLLLLLGLLLLVLLLLLQSLLVEAVGIWLEQELQYYW